MTETTTRRSYLLAVLRNLGGTVTTRLALQIYAVSPWRATSRNTARRDLRDLARRAYLVPVGGDGARAYVLGDNPEPAHPVRGIRQPLVEVVRREGGEWTVGRMKRACRRLVGTHIYRSTARRYLAELHRLGHLDRHGDDTPLRYYTHRQQGPTA
ncbi:hypothetical protein AB0N17_03355 [Streptomyces sp. NPDC051133]|uniref:hypothetical protein n=1 Tax=Streptomyces sp. NPDC051133 TaxID=3155521 RepID=UPI003415FE68